MLQVETIPAFADNYIWLIHKENSKDIAIVDPGDAEPVLEACARQGWRPAAILITHHHGDHVGGIRRLRQFAAGIPVYGPAGESIPERQFALREGDEVVLDFLDARFRVLDVPGHTRGHIAYYGHGLLFCGDTLFTGGCGRLFEGSPEQMVHSLEKIAALPDATLVYCAHEYTEDNLVFAQVVEPDSADLLQRVRDTHERRARDLPTVPSTLDLEKRTNPFLRCHRVNVKQAAEQFAQHRLESVVDTFAVVRHWKDVLDG